MLRWHGMTGRYLWNSKQVRHDRLDIAQAVYHYFNGNPSRPQDGIGYQGYMDLALIIAQQTDQIEFYWFAVNWFAPHDVVHDLPVVGCVIEFPLDR
jgi:hypothetical protein